MSFFKRLFSKKKKEKPKQTRQQPKGRKPDVIKDGMIERVVAVERYTAPKTIKEGEVLKIPISGHFSSAGWSLKKAYAKVNDNKIILTVIGEMKAGMMSAQVLSRFDTVIELDGLKKGQYVIQPERGITDQKRLTVEK
ncbi:MAG: hypothetical protein ACTSO7_05865 [Candidatus Heimdallarchaeota archaeon]